MDSARTLLTPAIWWEDHETLRRFLSDGIAAELHRLRPGVLSLPLMPWPENLDLRIDLGVDSLELLSIATTLADTLQMQHAGIEDYLLLRTSLADWTDIAKKSLSAFSEQIVFRTSGSSGDPKRCIHNIADLWQEVTALAPHIGNRKRIFCAVPSHHIYGFLFSILLPRLQLGNAEVIDARNVLPGKLASRLRDGDLLIGHPDYWQAMVTSNSSIPAGVIGLSSTAPCPDSTAHALGKQGLASLMQIYGSSETAGIGWRTDTSTAFRCMSFWRRDEASDLVRIDALGNHHRFSAPDILQWDDTSHFLPVGRVDHAVQVGGLNVYPSKVCNTLLDHPEVAYAAVRLMRPDEGVRLKAFIVPINPAAVEEQLAAKLRLWMRDRLSPSEVPASLKFGADLPKGASGKLIDWIVSDEQQINK